MEFATHYNRKKSPLEDCSKPCMVETAGYIPAQTRIENLIAAGLRLKEFRAEQFDFDSQNINEDIEIPYRSKNYDFVDANRDLYGIRQRIKDRNTKPSITTESSQTSSDQPNEV